MRKPAFQTILLVGISAAILISSQTAFAEPNLVSWWKFDEGSGTIAYDSTDSHDGTLVNGPVWTTGQIDGALSFDGSDDYVSVGNTVTHNLAKGTFTAWVYPVDLSSVCNGYNFAWVIGANYSFGGELGFRVNGDGSGWASVQNTVPSGALSFPVGSISVGSWHHVAMTWDGSYWKLYINGVQKDSKSFSQGTSNATNIALIAKGWDGCTWNGKIDDVRIYDRALSAWEVEQLYREGLGYIAFAPNPANGATGVDPNIVLSWLPGKDAVSHDVYLGTNFDDVNDANTSSPEYKGNRDVNNWDPCGLDICITYYWRIDEINEPNLWKGNIWSFETPRPVIELSAAQFEFTAMEGGENPVEQIFGISNSGVGTLNWQISKDCGWLSVLPTSGSSTGETDDVNLSVDISGLYAGVYTCELMISDPNAGNSPQVVSVNLIVKGLIGWWKFDEGSGTTAYDSAGSNNGTLVNGPVWTTGQIDSALSFDGADDYVDLGNSSNLKPPLPVTISAWIKLNTDGYGSPLYLDQPDYGIFCFADSVSAFRAFYYDGGGGGSLHRRGKTGTTVLAAGRWYHVAAVIRGQTDMNIYVDGADDGGTYSGTGGDLAYSNSNSYIGRYSSIYFNGVIDDVRLYDKALTAEAIWQIYQEGTVFSKATSPNPVSGATGVDPNIVLSWKTGKDAASHDVYFGTDYNDVNDANIVSPEYKGNFDVNKYDPCGLDFHTIYYWRVDEVNDANVWKGNVWNFKIADDDGKLHVPSEYSTIQEAINTSSNGDVVIVAPGTYYENVQILNKGITLRGEDPYDPCKVASTIINGGQLDSVINIDSTVTETIAGLTVTNGLASAGGGIKCSTTGSVNNFIRNCRITGNRTTDGRNEWDEIEPPYYTTPGGDGAGIYCSAGVYLELTGCIITNNICGQGGSSFYDCDIPGRKGGSGGGIYCIGSGIKIGDCQIVENHSGDGGDGPTSPLGCYTPGGEGGDGGGLYSSCSADINDSLFKQNTAGDSGIGRLVPSNGGKGGGIYSISYPANIRNSQFIGNTSGNTSGCLFCDSGESYGGDGGGIYRTGSAVIENCFIIQNTAGGGTLYEGCHSGNGGGIYCQSTSIKNCTIADNTIAASGQGGQGGGIYAGSGVSVRDSILWGNNAQVNPQIYGSPTVSYSDIQDGYSGTGNINDDPCFVTGPDSDYYLNQIAAGQAVDSPCVDAGSDTAANLGMEYKTTRTDEIGDGGVVDMGYHYTMPNPADIDGDGDVDFFDYAILASQWLQAPGEPSADIAPLGGDGIVNNLDLGVLADNWLEGF